MHKMLATIFSYCCIYLLLQATTAQGKSNCADPGVPNNGLRQGNDFSEDSTVKFQCNYGYRMLGSTRIRCQSNGQWSERIPHCIEIRCSNPSRPLYGSKYLAGTSIGDPVVYTCNPGFKLIGERVRICLPVRQWSGPAPTCVEYPVFIHTPRNATLRIGNYAILRCQTNPGTSMKITWLKNGKPFIGENTEDKIYIFKTMLFIRNVQLSDFGMYTCQASNKAGTIRAHAWLKMLGKKIPHCGIPKFTTRQRIFGGTVAGDGAHPWMAMLWSNKHKKPFCGGSLITENWVLTVAHCLHGTQLNLQDLRVKFGKTHINRVEPNEQTRKVIRVFKHPRFNTDTFDSDIALLKLESPVIITDYVIPICLPSDDSDFTLLKASVEGTISGLGSKNVRHLERGKYSRKLLEVKIPVADQTDCKSAMKYPVTPNMFCAGGECDGDACKGDAGGPFVIENKATKKHVLIGVTSWGEGCGRTYGVYVKLYNFLAWIKSTTK